MNTNRIKAITNKLRKIQLLLLGFLLSFNSASAIPTDGLIVHYPFNDSLQDVSGNNNHGDSILTTWTENKFGIPKQALLFDGNGSFMTCPIDINPSEMPQVTMTAWVRADTAEPYRQVFSHDNGYYDRSLTVDTRGGGTGWSAFAGSGEVVGYDPVNVGQWVFLAVVYDQDAGTVTLHVNDRQYKKQGRCDKGFNILRIGMNPGHGQFFRGAIDQVRVYNRALASDEIAELYQQFLKGDEQDLKLPIQQKNKSKNQWLVIAMGVTIIALVLVIVILVSRKKK